MEIKTTQEQRILEYMREHGSISTLEAFTECNCVRCGSVINSLRKKGYNITTEMARYKNDTGRRVSHAVYRIIE